MAKKHKHQRQQRGPAVRQHHGQIARLIERGRWQEAEDALRAVLQRDPNDREALSLLGIAASKLENAQSMWFAMTRLAALMPDDAETAYHAAMACYVNALPFSTLHYGRRFVSRWPDHPDAAEIRSYLPSMEALCKAVREEYHIVGEQSDEDAMLFEEARLLLEQGYYKQGRRIAELAAERMPDAAPPLNNLSLSYMIEGKMERALEIADEVLRRFPGNLHAQANRAQFLARFGRKEEAREAAEALRAVRPETADDWHKLLEAFTYLGDAAAVVSVYEDLQRAKDHQGAADSPLIQHWTAVAYSRLGDDKQARKLWQKALKTVPSMTVAEENLAELKKPLGKRAKAWPFSFAQWVPSAWIEEFVRIGFTARSSALERKFRQVFERNPALLAAIPILLERGDGAGREFALTAALMLELPVLAEFALSDQGTDDERFRAANTAAEAGLLPRGKPIKMWREGQHTDMILLAYEIHEEPPPHRLPRRAQSLMEQAYEAREEGDFEASLTLLDNALAVVPGNPMLMNHKAAALGMIGRGGEARAVVEQIVAAHPDYLFARCSLAEFLAQDGRLDEAHAWLDPLLERPRFHVSEFGALSKAHIEVMLAEGHVAGAKMWLDMFEQVNPDHYLLPYLRLIIKKRR